jgi:cytochrome c oxidase cbb3-type subunit II
MMHRIQSLIEEKVGYLIVFSLLVVSVAGLVEIVPLFFQRSTTEAVSGMKPYNALQLAGRDVYQKEGCLGCHSQMIRPLRAETERYGHYSVAGEHVWEHPFLWGSKRTGPDLARVGGRYSDEWHVRHLMQPRDVVPESVMPAYPWLADKKIDGPQLARNMHALQQLGVPYSDADIAGAAAAVKGKTEMDAMVAYLQALGTAIQTRR